MKFINSEHAPMVLLAVAAAAAMWISAGCSHRPSPAALPPNVIMVSLDTLRADHLGCFGYHRDTSPAIDALAAQSVVFDRAIAQSSHTTPSHLALFQSRLPWNAEQSALHLAEVFKRAGYRTAGFTGGGMLSQRSKYKFDRGFDRYEEAREGLGVLTPMIERWLGEGLPEPYFLLIHTYEIHAPYDSGEPYNSMFDGDYDGPVDPAQTRNYQRKLLGMKLTDASVPEIEWNQENRHRLAALYDGGIRAVDDSMRRLLDMLGTAQSWSWERDILVIISDHGEEFWDHGSVSHGRSLYQEIIRVPMIMRLPGARAAGLRVAQTVRLMDLGPTLLDLVGIPAPSSFRGMSLVPLLDPSEVSDLQIDAVSQSEKLRSVVSYPWKLILHKRRGDIQLFNLADDPKESSPVQDQYPDIVERLMRVIREQGQDESPGSAKLLS